MKINHILLLIAIVWSATAHANPANESEQIVNQALAALDNDYKSSWAYTRASTKNENPTTLGRFDPSLPQAEQWSLISLGDRAPTAKEQAAWVARRIQNDEDNKDGFGKMVTAGSVQLLEESATHWLFSFVPAPDKDDDKKDRKLISKVTGKLRVNKGGHFVEEISLANEEPVRPAMGVKIKLFEMQMTFGPISEGGPVVPLSVNTHVQGRAFLAVSIDDVKKVRFSEYQKVVPTSEN